MWILYQIAFALVLLLAGPLLVLRRGGHYLETLRGRLALDPGTRPAEPAGDSPVWLHAVSVGETGVAATLARAAPAALPLLVTTVTPTGQARARATLGRRAAVAYLPWELGFAVRRFLDRFAPRALVLVEGDLWPLVLRAATRRGLPVVVVNGRLGDRSFRRMRRLRLFLGPLLAPVDRFGVQTAEDRARLLRLGVPEERITVTGNLKFEGAAPAPKPELEAALRRLAGGRPILIAGSTMRGEEEQVLDAFEAIGGGERAMLVLAPRHPERWDEVTALLERRGGAARRRSELGKPDRVDSTKVPAPRATDTAPAGQPEASAGVSAEDCTGALATVAAVAAESEATRPAVVLLDTLGELAALYRLAAAAFIGGTLVPTGGHNPLEPARWGTPVVVGPSMENFREIAESFTRAEAWRQVSDTAGLATAWRTWLDEPETAAAVGRRGAALVESNRGALEKTLELLGDIFRPEEAPPSAVAG